MYNRKLQFHFIGIGGSGMSGLAEILLNLGFTVSGSDLARGNVVQRLEKLGAKVFKGHATQNLPNTASLVVYSSAVTPDNPEIVEANRRGLPVVRRAEVLAELMRLKYGVGVAGSHGKTTTTSMTAAILERAELDPTVIIGGQIRATDSGARVGMGQFLVAETDESDRSFLLLKPTIAIVTNIDAEHLNAYSSLSDLEESFATFVNSVPFYGLAILCIDDPKVRALADRFTRRKVTYGLSPRAQIHAEDIKVAKGTTTYTVVWHESGVERRMEICLQIPGVHIAQNSLAAIAVGLEFGIEPEVIRSALKDFSGVKRRLETIGESNGVTVINDYAHHPTEIKATLAALRAGWIADAKGAKLHVVFQPHRYTRTKDCFEEFLDAFKDADTLTLTDIYAASEQPIQGVTGQGLYEAVHHQQKAFVKTPSDSLARVKQLAKPGDVIACLGAGSVGAFAEELPALLNR